jgi:hypothetical protein
MEKISWTDRVRNEEVLQRVKKERNILHTIKRRKAKWIGHILCRNCLQNTIELQRRIEVTGSPGKDVSSYWMTLGKIEDTGS